MPTCTKCLVEKSLDDFQFQKERDSYRTQCRECRNAQRVVRHKNKPSEWHEAKKAAQSEWYQNNKDKHKDYCLLREYGITLEQYNQMLGQQDNVCAICHRPQRNGKGKSLYVDHNHETGEVRGLLCGNCNVMLGMAEDNEMLLRNAIEYLREGGNYGNPSR